MSYNYETNEIPVLFALRPIYDSAASEAAIMAATGQFNYGKRLKNASSPFDSLYSETKSFQIDMFDNVTLYTVGGVSLTRRQIAAFIKKVGDTEKPS